MGHDIGKDPISVKRVIDISPQETAIAERLNAWENLSLMAGLHGLGKQEATQRSEELLEMMGLTERAKERVKKYSGGMKRRLSIAMALVSDPQVLFLDEPTLGLDPQSRRAIWEHIEQLKGKTTIVLTTHYLEEADALADRIAVIDEGKVVALGTPTELKDSISGAQVTVVEAPDLTDDAIEALRQKYREVRTVEGGVEVYTEEVSLYDIEDCLRPMGIAIQSMYRKQVTLDDVFLHLTGKQLRE
jgi:ABC-2 type transport system ATP-binding protein